MAWLAAGLEGLDDDHAAAAAGARVHKRLRRIGVARRLGRRWGQVQELTHGLAMEAPINDRLFYPFQAENMAFVKLSLDEFGQQDPHRFAGTAKREVT